MSVNQQAKACATMLQALALPNRIRVIECLRTRSMNVTELAQALNVEIVNVSHHLGLMKAVGLVTATRHGRFRFHSLVGAKAVGDVLELTHASGAKVIVPLG